MKTRLTRLVRLLVDRSTGIPRSDQYESYFPIILCHKSTILGCSSESDGSDDGSGYELTISYRPIHSYEFPFTSIILLRGVSLWFLVEVGSTSPPWFDSDGSPTLFYHNLSHTYLLNSKFRLHGREHHSHNFPDCDLDSRSHRGALTSSYYNDRLSEFRIGWWGSGGRNMF